MRFLIGNTRVRVHPLLPVLWGIMILTGHGSPFLPAVLALFTHECGHILAAMCFGERIEEIEITPLGGIITLHKQDSLSPLRAFALAAAGPVFSFLGCLSVPFLYDQRILGLSAAGSFVRSSALLLFINLRPALPLDGGRMAQALFAIFFKNQKPNRVLYVLGAMTGACLCLVTLVFAFQGNLVLAPMFAGFYLFYAASIESRQEPIRYLTSLIDRRHKLSQEKVYPVQIVAAGDEILAKKILKCLSPGKYHLILALSPDGTKPIGMIDEFAFCESILSNQNQTLGQISQSIFLEH